MKKWIQGEGRVMREAPGYAALWGNFGLSRAAWLTLPRALMHEMPDEWQARMAALLDEFQETYTNIPTFDVHVQLRASGRFVPLPSWLEYRHPHIATIESFKGKHEA
jgi:hypothetical protein